MTPILYDYLDSGVQLIPVGKMVYQNVELTWPEDRYLIGWQPWMGFDKGTACESHLALFANGANLFVRGPHKENTDVYYDVADGAEFFPSGCGFLVPKGGVVILQLGVHNTGTAAFNSQGNARIFSVKS